jgi:hypothetical protein
MSRLRFTLAQLMAVVIFCGFGFAALRNADWIWASASYTLAFLIISFAPLAALARRGAARMVWAGFAIFGWARLLISVLPNIHTHNFASLPSPSLLTYSVFDFLMRYLWPRGFDIPHAQVFYSLEIILFGLVGSIVGSFLVVKDEQPNT